MGKNKLTIYDIAQKLNLSKSTVSRAIRGDRDIKPETRDKILFYIRDTGYEPDIMAQNLKSGKSKLIGVIVPAYNIPFYAIAISGIQDYAIERGYHIIICHSNDQTIIEKENLKSLFNARVEGIIISVAQDNDRNEHIRDIKNRKIPFVMFNRVLEDLKAAKVVVNDYYGAYQMTCELIQQSKSKVLYLAGPSNLLISKNRKMGFIDALNDKNIDKDMFEILESDFTAESGYEIIKEYIRKSVDFDTIFCVCDAVAFGVIKAIKKAGLIIPEDVAVAGFTNEPMTEYIDPTLTTVSQPIYDIGYNSAKLLFSQIDDPEIPAELCVLETKLVIRNSTRK